MHLAKLDKQSGCYVCPWHGNKQKLRISTKAVAIWKEKSKKVTMIIDSSPNDYVIKYINFDYVVGKEHVC